MKIIPLSLVPFLNKRNVAMISTSLMFTLRKMYLNYDKREADTMCLSADKRTSYTPQKREKNGLKMILSHVLIT